MKMPNGDRRLFRGSLGQILVLLHQGDRTVNELSEHLSLADNTVRAHLATLERDGFIEQQGLRPGVRKPHFAYRLTEAGEQLFLKACNPLLDNLLGVLAERETPETFEALLRNAAHRMAARYVHELAGAEPAQRIDRALALLGELGGVAQTRAEDGKVFVQGERCPLSVVVAEYPGACAFAETLLSDISAVTVREHCEHGDPPQCRFEFETDNDPALVR